MRRLSDVLGDDTNQFGPGTDLVVSVLAVVLVISLITSHLYRVEHEKAEQMQTRLKLQPQNAPSKPKEADGGNFKLASQFFTAADFYARPVTRLVDAPSVDERVERIAREYRQT